MLKSRSNDKIRLACTLRTSSKQRRESGCFFLEGARLCADAAACGVEIRTVFLSERAVEKYSEMLEVLLSRAESAFLVSESLSAALSDTVVSQGVFCICTMLPENKHIIEKNGKYIALDNVQNPDNVGVMSRTAEAMGFDGIIAAGGCDIYNTKAQRASAGSLLRMPIIRAHSLPDILSECSKNGMLTLACVPDSHAEKITDIACNGGVVCVVGNEGAGISREVIDVCEKSVTIPMAGRTESLNAAVAAAVAMWELTKK